MLKMKIPLNVRTKVKIKKAKEHAYVARRFRTENNGELISCDWYYI